MTLEAKSSARLLHSWSTQKHPWDSLPGLPPPCSRLYHVPLSKSSSFLFLRAFFLRASTLLISEAWITRFPDQNLLRKLYFQMPHKMLRGNTKCVSPGWGERTWCNIQTSLNKKGVYWSGLTVPPWLIYHNQNASSFCLLPSFLLTPHSVTEPLG